MFWQIGIDLIVEVLERHVNRVHFRLSVFAAVNPTWIVLRVDDGEKHLTVFDRRPSDAIQEALREDHVHVAEEQQSVGRVRVGSDLQTQA